jgi:hypothetical protein
LHTENAQLEGANAELSASNHRLEQTIKCLQVAVTIMLAVTWGLSVALATVMAGATVQITLSSAAGIFFGVIMTSMAILTFIGRWPPGHVLLARLRGGHAQVLTNLLATIAMVSCGRLYLAHDMRICAPSAAQRT